MTNLQDLDDKNNFSKANTTQMNPFISFCLYVAARVFVQYLRSRPHEQQIRSSLQFLLSAMQALRRKNPLTESFIAQLDVDIESAGVEGLRTDPQTFRVCALNVRQRYYDDS